MNDTEAGPERAGKIIGEAFAAAIYLFVIVLVVYTLFR